MSTLSQAYVPAGHRQAPAGIGITPADLSEAAARGGHDLFTLTERLTFLKNFGGTCMSFSLLQPGMHYFDMPGTGFIAYREKWGVRAVLSDPVCDPRHRDLLLREFLKDGRNTGFVQISQGLAELLHDAFGYYSTQFGVEITVDCAQWNLKGKKKQVIRTSANRAKDLGVVIAETCRGNACRALSDAWLNTRTVRNREIVFLIRPMEMEYQEGTRKFYAYHRDELIGFIFFDPVYDGSRVVGYTPSISRSSSAFRQGIFYPLMAHAMEVFREEGVERLYLGLCPAKVDGQALPCESAILKRIIRLLYEYGNWIFSFKGLYFTKTRFDGTEHRTFCAHRQRLPIRPFLALFRLINII